MLQRITDIIKLKVYEPESQHAKPHLSSFKEIQQKYTALNSYKFSKVLCQCANITS